MAVGLIEHTIMTNLRREYEEQGYAFYENPPPGALPAFLGKFQPDAIAVRGEEGVVLELKPSTAKPDALNYIADRFAGQTRWQFRVIFYHVPEETNEVEPTRIPFKELRSRVIRLQEQGEMDGALLLGWATLEAVLREKSAPSSYRIPTTPKQIAERLEHFGIITAEQAQLLQQAAVVRASVAHGRFDLRPGTGLVEVLLDVAQALNQMKGRLPHQ